jgi:hypothetical protein
VPGSGRGRTPAAAVAPDGTLLVAWRRAAPRRCGAVVLAAVARPGRGFGVARRVSSRCPHAAAVRAAMAGDGTGAVVWRAGRARDRYSLRAAVLGRRGFGRGQRVSRRPVVGFGAELAGGATGALVVWRDRIAAGTEDVRGRVLAADVGSRGTGEIRRVSESDRVVGVPRVAARPDGSAVVAWEEVLTPPRVLVAARPGAAAPFGPPEVVDGCGAVDASRTYASPALDGRGSPAVIFQSACMERFGLGTDYGIVLSSRPPGDGWLAPSALTHGTYSVSGRLGAADDGQLAAAWVESGASGGLRATVLAP